MQNKNGLPRVLPACAFLMAGCLWAANARAADTPAAPADAVLAQVKAYRFGEDRKPLVALELLVGRTAPDPAARRELAAKLGAILSSDASVDAKQLVCRMLSAVGSAGDVPALAKLLSDETLADSARLALERIGGEESAAALRAALASTKGRVRVGVISSLGALRDERVVADPIPLAGDVDVETAGAAIRALGLIGNEPAGKALLALAPKAPAELKDCLGEAMLQCAERGLLGQGDTAAILAQLTAPSQPAPIRQAAFLLSVRLSGREAGDRILAALGGEDAALQSVAIRALRECDDPAVLRTAAERLPKLAPRWQAAVVAILGDRGDASAVPGLVKMMATEDVTLRRATIVALGKVGDGSTVAVLLEKVSAMPADEHRFIVEAMARLRGADVEPKLIEPLRTASPAAQVVVIRALSLRASPTAVAALNAAVENGAPAVRRQAMAALGDMGSEDSAAVLLKVIRSGDPADQQVAVRALSSICRRTGKLDAVLTELKTAGPAEKASLLSVLGTVGGADALSAIRAEAKGNDPAVRTAAIRMLSEWSDPAVLDDLAELARTSTDAREKALAIRGLARLAPQAKDRAPEKVAGLLAATLEANSGTAERKTLLAALGQIPAQASLRAASACLDRPELIEEASQAVLSIVESTGTKYRDEAKAAVAKITSMSKNPAILGRAAALAPVLSGLENLSLGATAKGTEGLEPDGEGRPAEAAIDGKPETYWDEVDNQKLYTITVQLKQRSSVACLRIAGYRHHNYAPRTFDVLLDGKVAKSVKDAVYQSNALVVDLPPGDASTVELRITGYYGASPAIRELEIYGKPASK